MAAEADNYEKAEAFINPNLFKGGRVLDIGNRGILNYDYTGLTELVCADISVSKKIADVYKDVSNVLFIESNIMDMNNIENACFDAVIVQKVIHHLTEKDYKTTRLNCEKAIKKCVRVLNPGGVLTVCESTVKRWFEKLEITFFKVMLKCCDLVKFDGVFQYSPKTLKAAISKEVEGIADIETVKDIGTGRHILFWEGSFRYGYFLVV